MRKDQNTVEIEKADIKNFDTYINDKNESALQTLIEYPHTHFSNEQIIKLITYNSSTLNILILKHLPNNRRITLSEELAIEAMKTPCSRGNINTIISLIDNSQFTEKALIVAIQYETKQEPPKNFSGSLPKNLVELMLEKIKSNNKEISIDTFIECIDNKYYKFISDIIPLLNFPNMKYPKDMKRASDVLIYAIENLQDMEKEKFIKIIQSLIPIVKKKDRYFIPALLAAAENQFSGDLLYPILGEIESIDSKTYNKLIELRKVDYLKAILSSENITLSTSTGELEKTLLFAIEYDQKKAENEKVQPSMFKFVSTRTDTDLSDIVFEKMKTQKYSIKLEIFLHFVDSKAVKYIIKSLPLLEDIYKSDRTAKDILKFPVDILNYCIEKLDTLPDQDYKSIIENIIKALIDKYDFRGVMDSALVAAAKSSKFDLLKPIIIEGMKNAAKKGMNGIAQKIIVRQGIYSELIKLKAFDYIKEATKINECQISEELLIEFLKTEESVATEESKNALKNVKIIIDAVVNPGSKITEETMCAVRNKEHTHKNADAILELLYIPFLENKKSISFIELKYILMNTKSNDVIDLAISKHDSFTNEPLYMNQYINQLFELESAIQDKSTLEKIYSHYIKDETTLKNYFLAGGKVNEYVQKVNTKLNIPEKVEDQAEIYKTELKSMLFFRKVKDNEGKYLRDENNQFAQESNTESLFNKSFPGSLWEDLLVEKVLLNNDYANAEMQKLKKK